MVAVIGRESELQFGEAWVHSLADGPSLLVLQGEPGMGKTTLWAAIASRAEQAGIRVFRARPTAVETSLTLSWLSDLFAELPGDVVAALPSIPVPSLNVDASL